MLSFPHSTGNRYPWLTHLRMLSLPNGIPNPGSGARAVTWRYVFGRAKLNALVCIFPDEMQHEASCLLCSDLLCARISI